MTASDELEKRLCHFLEDLVRELPVRGDTASPYELRLFAALVHSTQKDLRSLWEGPEMSGGPKRSGDDDEYDWRRLAADDIKNKSTFTRSLAWLDLFFQKHAESLASKISPLSQLRARLSMFLQEPGISNELLERVREVSEELRDAPLLTWEIILEKYDG